MAVWLLQSSPNNFTIQLHSTFSILEFSMRHAIVQTEQFLARFLVTVVRLSDDTNCRKMSSFKNPKLNNEINQNPEHVNGKHEPHTT